MATEKSIRKRQHKLSNFKLEKLLEITHAINSNFEVEGLLNLYQEILQTHLGIEKLVLYGYDDNWLAMHHFGVQGQPDDIEDSSVFSSDRTGSFQLSSNGRMKRLTLLFLFK